MPHHKKHTRVSIWREIVIFILWHVRWRPEYFSQQRQLLPGNSSVITFPWLAGRTLLHASEDSVSSPSAVTSRDNRGLWEAVFSVPFLRRLYLENRKSMTAKRSTPEGRGHTFLFLVTPARYQQAPEIFKLTKHWNIFTKIEAYRAHSATIVVVLAVCWCILGSLPAACDEGVVVTIMNAQRNRTQGVFQPAAVATCKTGNRHPQQVAEAAVMENRNYSVGGPHGRQHRGQQGEHSSENM